MSEHRLLVLSDGSVYSGLGFGAPALTLEELDTAPTPEKSVGEVVFNTAMSGYHEVLTDPSYTGQLVAMTYPHMGNYGTFADWSEIGPEGPAQRVGVKAAGFVIRSLYRGPVPEGRATLHEFLVAGATPGISEIDTRRLTLSLRNEGTRNGVILERPGGAELSAAELGRVKAFLAAFPLMEGRNLIGDVGTTEVTEVNAGGTPRIALLDCGAKANIIRELVALGCSVSVLPSVATASTVREGGYDALLVSNGPGDPAVLAQQVETLRSLVGETPLLGICLGHQLIAEAIGARTHKMSFGHHGVNHPVRDEITRRVFVTSQNHGFAVDEDSLPEGAMVWLRNANDQSVEGLLDTSRRIRTAQFHPESAPGPHDSKWIFASFLEMIK